MRQIMAEKPTEEEIQRTQWMFQYNPNWYDLEGSAQRSLVEDWVFFKHRKYVRVGQRIYFMRSGDGHVERRAFTAVGRIASPIYEKPEPRNIQQRYFLDVVYDYFVDPIFTQPEILNDSNEAFKKYHPYVVGEFTTATRLPTEIARRTEEVLQGRLRPIGTSHVRVDTRIFVSHSSKDTQWTKRLVEALRAVFGGQQESVWFDEGGSLGPGAQFVQIISKEVLERPIFIIVVSPDSMDFERSGFVQLEVNMAVQQSVQAAGGKVIIPVLYHQTPLAPQLAGHKFVSFIDRPFDEAVQELIPIVTQLRLRSSLPDPVVILQDDEGDRE
jgi:TIR domain-containing protein